MSIHNLLEYSQIYSLTLQSLQNYYRKTTERSGNEGDANRSAVTTLNVEVTLALNMSVIFGGFLIYI